jgi:hypothetical protein
MPIEQRQLKKNWKKQFSWTYPYRATTEKKLEKHSAGRILQEKPID